MESSSFGRLVGVLTSPRRTFEAIAERPTWLVALLVICLLGSVSVWAAFSRLEPEGFARSIAEQSGRDLPPQANAETLLTVTKWSGVVGAAVVAPLLYLAMAGLLLVGLRMLGSEIEFRRAFSVTLHGMMPFAVAALVGTPIALAKETLTLEEVQGGSLLASHLGFLAGEDASKALVALLTSVDMFSIWCIVLLTIGLHVVGRVSKGAAAMTVGVVWALGIAVKVGSSALR